MPEKLQYTLARRGPRTDRRLHSPIGPVTIEQADSSVIVRTSLRSARGMTEVSIAIGKGDFATVLNMMMRVDRAAFPDASRE